MTVKGGIGGLLSLLCLSMLSGCVAAPATAHKTFTLDEPWTLVSFGAPWCSVCQKLEPELARFHQEQPNVRIQRVDVEVKDSPAFQTYFPRYYHGRAIPLTVLIDQEGRARKDWTGYKNYLDLVAEIRDIETNTSKEAKR